MEKWKHVKLSFKCVGRGCFVSAFPSFPLIHVFPSLVSFAFRRPAFRPLLAAAAGWGDAVKKVSHEKEEEMAVVEELLFLACDGPKWLFSFFYDVIYLFFTPSVTSLCLERNGVLFWDDVEFWVYISCECLFMFILLFII